MEKNKEYVFIIKFDHTSDLVVPVNQMKLTDWEMVADAGGRVGKAKLKNIEWINNLPEWEG